MALPIVELIFFQYLSLSRSLTHSLTLSFHPSLSFLLSFSISISICFYLHFYLFLYQHNRLVEIWRCKEGSCLGSGCIRRWHFYTVHTVLLHADILALITSNSSICLTTTAQIIYGLSICLTWVSFYALNPLIFFSHLLIQGFFDDQFPALKRFLPGHLSSTGADDDDDEDE